MTHRTLFAGEDLALEVDGAVASIVLHRPPVNAFRMLTWQEFALALRTAAETTECSVLILRSGVDGIFSAGADVKEMPTGAAAGAQRQEITRSALQALGSFRTPVVAVIDGAVIGGRAPSSARPTSGSRVPGPASCSRRSTSDARAVPGT